MGQCEKQAGKLTWAVTGHNAVTAFPSRCRHNWKPGYIKNERTEVRWREDKAGGTWI